jgi:hypothetical protein
MEWGTKFWGEFLELCELTLINYKITFHDHLKLMNMDMIVWLAMRYQFNKEASLASFFFYFLLFNYEPQLLASIS